MTKFFHMIGVTVVVGPVVMVIGLMFMFFAFMIKAGLVLAQNIILWHIVGVVT